MAKQEAEDELTPLYKLPEHRNRTQETSLRVKKGLELTSRYGWPQVDAELKTRLLLRDFRPMLPAEFQRDFPGLPDVLFSTNREAVFVQNSDPSQASNFVRSMLQMMTVGTRVRELVQNKDYQGAERRIRSAVKGCIKFGLMDAGTLSVHQRPDNVVVLPAWRTDGTTSWKGLQEQTVHAFQELCSNWKLALGADNLTTPPLYAVTVKGTVMAFRSYDYKSEVSGSFWREIAQCDFADPHDDIWNAFAVMMLALHARDEIVKVVSAYKLREWKAPDDDPDL